MNLQVLARYQGLPLKAVHIARPSSDTWLNECPQHRKPPHTDRTPLRVRCLTSQGFSGVSCRSRVPASTRGQSPNGSAV
jgi:hypothetical protein